MDGSATFLIAAKFWSISQASRPRRLASSWMSLASMGPCRPLRRSRRDLPGWSKRVSVIAWTVNADGIVGDIPLWRKFSGHSLADVSGRGWFTAIHPDDQQGAENAW